MRSHINRYFFFRKPYGAVSQALLRPIMSLGSCLRLPKFLALYGLAPSRRPEAAPKIRAARIALLGFARFARQPWRLTPELRRQNELASASA